MDRAPEPLAVIRPPDDIASRMLTVLDCLSDARTDRAGWPAFVEALAHATGASRAVVFTLSGRAHGEAWIPWRLTQDAFDQWYGIFRHLDPWLAATRMPAQGEYCVVAGERLVSDERLRRTEYFERYLRPNDLRWMRAGWLRPRASHASIYGVVLFRGLTEPPFDTAAEGVIDRVLRHLQVDERYAVANAMSRAHGPDDADRAVFLLNTTGGLVMCNRRADEWMLDGSVTPSPEALSFSSPAATFWLESLTRRGVAETTGNVARLRERLPGTGIVNFELRAFRPIDQALSLHGVRHALTLAREASPNAIPAARSLQRLYRWTSSEFDTVCRLAAGDELPAIATARGCAIETVRSHLKNAKRKARVKRQVDLVRLMISVEPRSATGPESIQ